MSPLPAEVLEQAAVLEQGAEVHGVLLESVDTLRNVFPPHSPSLPAEALAHDARSRGLRALSLLGGALRSAVATRTPLLPLQFSVLIQQLAHILSVVRSWDDASSSGEECLDAALECLPPLLDAPLQSVPGGGAEQAATLLGAPSARASTCQLISELLLAAAAQRPSTRRARCIHSIWHLLRLPLPRAFVGYMLPGVVSQLVGLSAHVADGQRLHTATSLALIGCVHRLLTAVQQGA